MRSLLPALAGRLLSMPASRCRATRSDEWPTTKDGTRLAAAAFHPEREPTRATLVVRSVAPVHGARNPLLLLARLLAEQGHAVVVAGCRGLHRSEGRFEPFVADGADGADLLDWTAGQPWCAGPLALLGFGYAGHAAWSTLAAARRPVDGCLVGFAARDPYAWLHAGGARRLEAMFDLALTLAAAEPEGLRRHDLARALKHRPLAEADRIAARRIDWLRAWLDHPTRDAFWEERTPPIARVPAETWLVGGFHHAALPALLDDHAALVAAAGDAAPSPRLLVGPWSATPLPRPLRERGARMLPTVARACAEMLGRLVGDARATAPVRAFVPGIGWRERSDWPPGGRERTFHLAGSGRAAIGGDDRNEREGVLADAPDATPGAADAFVYDPADAAPATGPAPLRDGDRRGDVLRYRSEPLSRSLEIGGVPSLTLHAGSSVAHTDFAAELFRERPDGTAVRLATGIARATLPERGAAAVEITLSPVWSRVPAGDRLRLDVGSAAFPRFDRHPNTASDLATADAGDADVRVARQRVLHDAEHPSALRLPLVSD